MTTLADLAASPAARLWRVTAHLVDPDRPREPGRTVVLDLAGTTHGSPAGNTSPVPVDQAYVLARGVLLREHPGLVPVGISLSLGAGPGAYRAAGQ